ncbi:MAG: hypothetical protein AAGB19_20640, partial [Cyanobacteria bacterium P01_F01_bin.3]
YFFSTQRMTCSRADKRKPTSEISTIEECSQEGEQCKIDNKKHSQPLEQCSQRMQITDKRESADQNLFLLYQRKHCKATG